MTIREKIFKECKKLSEGQEFPNFKFNQYIKNPCYFNHVIKDKDKINSLYKLLKNSDLHKIVRTPSGGIKMNNIHHIGGAWDYKMCYTARNVFKGVIITVIIGKTVFVFKCGNFKVKDSEMTGNKAFELFAKECKKFDIDLKKYSVDNGKEVKDEIEKPIIRNFTQHETVYNVNHIDLNSAWPSNVSEVYPELKQVFVNLRKKDKLIGDMALGYCQSEWINYHYSNLSKAGINGCNEKILDLVNKLMANEFDVLGINTDGIWYRDLLNKNRLYTDENEGTELGQWKTDHKNCEWYAFSDGQYYFIEDGKFNAKARGYYAYEQVKPRNEWNRDDFLKAMQSLVCIEFDENEGFVIYEN